MRLWFWILPETYFWRLYLLAFYFMFIFMCGRIISIEVVWFVLMASGARFLCSLLLLHNGWKISIFLVVWYRSQNVWFLIIGFVCKISPHNKRHIRFISLLKFWNYLVFLTFKIKKHCKPTNLAHIFFHYFSWFFSCHI